MAEMGKREQIPVGNSSIEQLVSQSNSFSPDVNIYDNREALIFSIDMPGVRKGDVSIEIDESNILSIKGKLSFKEPEGKAMVKEFDVGN